MAIKSQTQRSLLLGFIASIAACGLVGAYCLAVGRIGNFEARILLSTVLVGAVAILGLAAAVAWDRRRWHPVGALGLLSAGVVLLVALLGIWADYLGVARLWESGVYHRVFVTAWVAAVGFPLTGLLGLANLHSRYTWVRRWTVITIVALAGTIIALFMYDPARVDEAAWRVIGVLSVITVCGTLAVPIFHRISSIRSRNQVRTTELCMSLTCPRCLRTQQVPVGRSTCESCRLRFTIEIEEEQCRQCGYPLYQLHSAQCPECGTPITEPMASVNSGLAIGSDVTSTGSAGV